MSMGLVLLDEASSDTRAHAKGACSPCGFGGWAWLGVQELVGATAGKHRLLWTPS